MYELAEESLKHNKSLKKVIILNSLPRYDPKSRDPLGIKEKLNQLGNSFYTSLWMQKGCPENITIQDQKLDCQGPLREKRFGKMGDVAPNGKPCDGVHMRGRLAVRHYTNSVIRIFASVYQSEVSTERKGKSFDTFHETCPQTRYQHNWSKSDERKSNTYRSGGKNNRRNQMFHPNPNQWSGPQNTGYNIPLSNRFNPLNY